MATPGASVTLKDKRAAAERERGTQQTSTLWMYDSEVEDDSDQHTSAFLRELIHSLASAVTTHGDVTKQSVIASFTHPHKDHK